MEVPLTDAQYIPNVGLNHIFNMLNKLRLLVINVRRRTVLFIVCKYILFLKYVKVAPTVREKWPKT